MLIKICGVQDPEIAAFSAQAGAHFIGMILTSGYRRSVSLPQAKEIAKASRDHGAIPVALFVAANAVQIEESCDKAGIDCVQAYRLSMTLPQRFKRFYVNVPDVILRPGCDFLLMEGEIPGSGKKVDISPPSVKPWFIAGGLTFENVKETILNTRPDGVDVSSGVEKNGMKDRNRILQFIKEVKSCE